jgi:hypothetical protein
MPSRPPPGQQDVANLKQEIAKVNISITFVQHKIERSLAKTQSVFINTQAQNGKNLQ